MLLAKERKFQLTVVQTFPLGDKGAEPQPPRQAELGDSDSAKKGLHRSRCSLSGPHLPALSPQKALGSPTPGFMF